MVTLRSICAEMLSYLFVSSMSLLTICHWNLVLTNGQQNHLHQKRHQHHHRNRLTVDCSMHSDAIICDTPDGKICRNKTCVSACSVQNLHKCACPVEDDNYCYLCCGNEKRSCKPAHDYRIFKPNGERWERDTCTSCVNNINGLSCDNRDNRRVCYNGQCAATVCHGLPEGEFCDTHKQKVCADSECRHPCKDYKSDFMTCECGEYSEDRCQLCCFDPRTKRCENAHRKYGISNRDGRPIYRHGLPCRRGMSCNKYGTCCGATSKLSLFLLLFGLLISYRSYSSSLQSSH